MRYVHATLSVNLPLLVLPCIVGGVMRSALHVIVLLSIEGPTAPAISYGLATCSVMRFAYTRWCLEVLLGGTVMEYTAEAGSTLCR